MVILIQSNYNFPGTSFTCRYNLF